MKLKLLLLFSSCLVAVVGAMDKKHTLPKADAIKQCLNNKGLHHFDQKTKISTHLGSKSLTHNQVTAAVNQHINSYCANIQRPIPCAQMHMSKNEIQSCLIAKK